MALHQAYAAQFGSTVLAGLTNLDSQTNPEVRAEVGIGSLFPQFAYVAGIKPKVMFNSRAIAAVLGVTGTSGAKITGSALFKAFYAKLAEGDVVNASEHQIYTFNRGLLLPRRLQCSHQQDATIDVEALCYSSDGATDPLIQSVGALPSIAQDNVRYTLKSAQVGGVDIGCITDVSIDFGIQAETVGCKSDVYDKHIQKGGGQTATISITTLDAAALGDAAIPLKGKAAAHANTSIVFRKRADDGIGFEDEADITITSFGLATYQSHSGQGPQRSQATIQITCAWDGTNAPLVLSL